uniref:DUF7086 domain-containing protein n=1 Tax=Oryza punctata TaxID=4537 RepID=A0A0E0L201_ORYPU
MTGLLVYQHGNDGVVFTAARVLFTDDVSAPCFNFLGPSMSPICLSHLEYYHQRYTNASMTNCNGSDDDESAPHANIRNASNNDNNDNANPPNQKAKHYSIFELSRRGIITIEGSAQSKYQEAANYFIQNHQNMLDRALERWIKPNLPDCDNYEQHN